MAGGKIAIAVARKLAKAVAKRSTKLPGALHRGLEGLAKKQRLTVAEGKALQNAGYSLKYATLEQQPGGTLANKNWKMIGNRPYIVIPPQ